MNIINQSPRTPGFADSTFYGINAFHMTNADGTTAAVRWMAVPLQAPRPAPSTSPATANYLFDALIREAANRPLRWRLVLTIGAPPAEPTHSSSRPLHPALTATALVDGRDGDRAQLLIGVTMIVSLAYYPLLLAIHRPLGVLI